MIHKQFPVTKASLVRLIAFLATGVLGFSPWAPMIQDGTTSTVTATEAPSGFMLVSDDIGVSLFRKDYQQGSPDFVQVVDLSQGATLKLLYAQTGEPRKGKGMFGGNDTRFQYQSLGQYWHQANSLYQKTFCVFNGLFFYMPENPTRLAMPLKADGAVITEGFGYPQYEGQELMLELWPGQAQIRKLSRNAFYDSSAPDIIAGLTEEANKRLKYAVARTFVGIDDRDDNNSVEMIYILNTSSATQAQAAATLREWGADHVMMLDGGGSTQLMCRSGWIIQSERLIPQALAVVAGSGPPYQASFTRIPNWAVVVAEGDQTLEIEIQNDGSQTWETGQTALLIEKKPWGADEWLDLPSEVAPGERIVIHWPAKRLYRSKVYQIEASMTYLDRKFPSPGVTFYLVVLPANQTDQLSELQSLIASWSTNPEGKIEEQVESWLQSTQNHPTEQVEQVEDLNISVKDMMWVPLIMLPFVGLLILILSKSRN